MNKDLTQGPVMRTMLCFAVPMILGDLLQQCYNVADTLIVGQFLGKNALAAVGSSFTLMTFLTSILLGLCLGSGAVFSIRFGQRDENGLREGVYASFVLIGVLALVLNAVALACLDWLQVFLRVDDSVWGLMRDYLAVVFCGIGCLFLLYGLYRALGRPGMSVVLTVISLGTRVALAYALSAIPALGVVGIWLSVPIGWALADAVGLLYYAVRKKQLFSAL